MPGHRAPDAPNRAPGAVALLALATLAAALSGPWNPPLSNRDLMPEELLPTEVPTVPPPAAVGELDNLDPMQVRPWDLTWLGLILLAVLILWLSYLAIWWLRRHPLRRLPGPPDDGGILPGHAMTDQTVAPSLPVLREGISAAGDELLGGRSPVDGVIAAWVALEAGAARSGVVRHPASTPTEFTVAVLDSTPADPAATRSLLALYLRARFGAEHMTEQDVATAAAALRTLAAGLGTPDHPEVGP
jgi:hypothetical protein